MNGYSHNQINRAAYNFLPEWQKVIWKKERDKIFNLYANYPDFFADKGRPEEEKAKIDPNWKKYLIMPNGESIHGGAEIRKVTKKDLYCYMNYGGLYQCPYFQYRLQHLLKSLLINMKQDKLAEAAKFAGCLSHYIADLAHPVHQLPYALIMRLFPKTEKFKFFHMHTRAESLVADVTLTKYKPRLLGVTLPEIVFRLKNELKGMIIRCYPELPKLMETIYSGRERKEISAVSRTMNETVKVVSDAIYSIFCIAYERVNDQEKIDLETFDMRNLHPVNIYIDLMYGEPIIDASMLWTKSQGVPFKLITKDKGRFEKHIFKGIGVLPDAGCAGRDKSATITYDLTPMGYSKLKTLVGLNYEISERGAVRFIVLGDGRELYQSPIICRKTPAREITVNIKDIRNLSLEVRACNEDETHCIYNHAVWANPQLLK